MARTVESHSADEKAARDRVIQHYNRLAPRYSELYQGRTRLAHFYNIRQARVLEFLDGVAKGSRVLEVGCGPAYLAGNIVMKDMQYVGVDISTGMIELCKERNSKVDAAEFFVGDTQRLAFSSSCFDVVLCLGMLEYVPREEMAIKEMARVLRRNGTCIISGINKWSPYNTWDRLLYRKVTGRRPAAIVHEYHAEKGYRELLAHGSLRVEDVVYFDFNVFLPPLDRRIASMAVAASEKLEPCCRSRLRKLGNGFLIKCIKSM